MQSMCSGSNYNHSSFELVNASDFSKVCRRSEAFEYVCGTTTTFVELESVANIFLLTGWTFFTDKNLQACKDACSSDCSCQGISYQNSTSNCFLITQNISLLTITQDSNQSAWNYIATSLDTIGEWAIVRKNDFVTHLKVASPVSTSTRFPLITLTGIIPFCIVMCFLLGLGLYHFRKRRSRLRQQAKEEEELRVDILPLLPTRFSFKELQEATKRFSKLLGSGACGSVYEGTLLDGREVAVKVLEGVLQRAHQAKDFLAEIATVGRTDHHNIVHLVGFCWQGSHHILVYEFMVRGSLDQWLFRHTGDGPPASALDWQKRYNVALGVARGLQYLHEECEQPILHSDIKPQNILLSEQFVAKISDFGMSRLMKRDMQSCVMTGVKGTPGYIARQWFLHGSVSKKSDIYSLGIVMLEIVAGRKVLEFSRLNTTETTTLSADGSSAKEAWHLPSWAEKKWEQGCLMDIVDPFFHEELVTHSNNNVGGFDEVEAQKLLYIALWCIQEDPALRPHATTVVKWLEGCEPNVPQPPHASNSTRQTI
ncbi:hypothetical protein GOP47_0006756 [Adiantum capillus-veneris]|uniref:Protein kinase domain-containing protein n=1 Tax=Adiantum capillus-veneris TaxID=13818 RepID=A0A9D4V415_ADICA|nr:hypothetical protein GOP47_0006756 [Adiantum capillus-veneris]